MSANIISEFLLSLGFQDNASKDFDKTLKDAEKKAKNTVKNVALAGAAVGTVFATAATGVVKVMKQLRDSNKEVKEFARQNKISEAEAFKLKTTLDAMGKTLDEIKEDAELSRMFKRLQEDAAKITPPDMSEGLAQVEAISEEFTRLRHAGAYAVQWVGHYLFKYLQQPLEKTKQTFGSLNDNVIKGMPKWTNKIAQVMASVIKLGITVLRGAVNIFKAIKGIFDMIPKEIKIVTAALAALALFIKAGPIKQLIAVFTIALLLLEDFYTYVDGGNALLGGFWQKLIDIWAVLKESGVISGIWDAFSAGLEYVCGNIIAFKDYILDLYKTLKENGTFEKIGNTLYSVGKAITTVAGKLKEMGLLRPILKGLLAGFLGFKAIKGAVGFVSGLTGALEKTEGAVKLVTGSFDKLKNSLNIANVFKNLGKVLGPLPKLFSPIVKLFSKNPFMIWIVAIGALIGVFATLYNNSEGFKAFAEGIKEKIRGIAEKITAFIPELLEMIPDLIDAGIELLTALIEGIVSMLPTLIKAFIDIITKVLKAITKYLPKIIKAGIEILKALIKGIVSLLPQLIRAAIDLLLAVTNAIIDNLPMIIDAGIEILLALIEGIVAVLPALIIAAIDLLLAIVDAIIENIDVIIDGGIKIVVALIEGLIKAIPRLILAMPKIVSAIMEGLGKAKKAVFELGKTLIGKLWEGILSMGSWIGNKVGGFVSDLFSKDKVAEGIGSSEVGGGGMPGHAEGGIFDKAHIAHVSEGNQPEAIIPLARPKRAQEVLAGAMNYLGLNSPESIEGKIKGVADFTQKASGMLSALGNGMSQAPIQSMNSSSVVNYNNIDMGSSYTINGAERPEAVASAVDRKEQVKYRNLKGVLG